MSTGLRCYSEGLMPGKPLSLMSWHYGCVHTAQLGAGELLLHVVCTPKRRGCEANLILEVCHLSLEGFRGFPFRGGRCG